MVPTSFGKAEAVLRASKDPCRALWKPVWNHDLRLKSLFHFPLLGGQGSTRTAASSHHQTLSSRPTGMTCLQMGGRDCGQHDLVLPEPLPGGLLATSHTSSRKEQVTQGDRDGTHPLTALVCVPGGLSVCLRALLRHSGAPSTAVPF